MIYPIVEVIIPVFNCENYLATCIEHIQNQTLKPQILLLDDGSTDASRTQLEKYSNEQVKIDFHKKNEGNLKTINHLLAKCSSDYIAFQDADDWSATDRLELQFDFLQQHQLDFCFTNFIKTDAKEQELYCGFYADEFITSENIEKLEPNICFASILFKKKVYEKIGGFDEYFNRIGAADIDWLYRAFSAGFKGGVVKKPLYYYRNNEVSYTSNVSLDPRKQISVAIARYLYQQRKKYGIDPQLAQLDNFIDQKLTEINFNEKNNRRDYVVQAIYNKKYRLAMKNILKYLSTKPIRLTDFKIINYLLHKIVNGK